MKIEHPTAEQLSIVMRWKLHKNGLRRTQLFDSLTWFKRNPQELIARVTDFEDINATMSEFMRSKGELRREFRDVSTLRNWYGGSVLPSLDDLSYANNNQDINGAIEGLLDQAVETFPEWAVIHEEYPSPGTPAMGALIEGYGKLLGRLKSGADPELASTISRTYVLGFEEVLLLEKPGSPLIDDVIGWVGDEYKSFPGDLRTRIFREALGFNQRMRAQQEGQVNLSS